MQQLRAARGVRDKEGVLDTYDWSIGETRLVESCDQSKRKGAKGKIGKKIGAICYGNRKS
jgi:hypothetical protein